MAPDGDTLDPSEDEDNCSSLESDVGVNRYVYLIMKV
jgi:hypothetical protein